MSNSVNNTSYNLFKILANNYLDKKLNLCSQLEAKVKDVREKINYTTQDIQEINKASNKYKIESIISSITAYFLKIFSPDKYDDYMLRNQYVLDRIKYINKLAGVQSSKINVDAEVGKPLSQTVENDLISLLCDEHIFERMKKFGHHFAPGQEPQFRWKKIDNLQDIFNPVPFNTVTLENQINFFEGIKGDGLEIRIRGRFEDGLYKSVPLDGLSKDQIKEIVINNDSKNIDLVKPTKLLNINELLDLGIIQRDDQTNALFVTEGFQYLGNGFEYRPDSGWQHMEPIGKEKNPSKEFKLEVLIHRPKNGDMGAQGHASLRLSTPSGEVYSVGFFPENQKFGPDVDEDPSTLGKYDKDTKIRRGAIQIPDRFIFLPELSFETEKITFDLKGSENFHKVIDYIHKFRGNPVDENGVETSSDLLFQASHHNCAVFAKEIADFAAKNGAKRLTKKPSSFSWKRVKAALTAFVLNVVSNLPGISSHFKASNELKGTPYENLKVTELFGRTVFLPKDLPYALA